VKAVARYYEDQWPAYVSVADRRGKAEREASKLRKKGAVLSPVAIEGKKIATTFWGKAWCENLESYRDYEHRLERGRSYARNGLVIDLQIAPHLVTAIVCGSSVYTIRITINELPKARWKSICSDCAGGIDSLVELLQGRFSKGVMERICRQDAGLFPKPSDIKFACSCLDHASMCKHVAGALYGVGARLDAKPELLFRLRGVDENDLVANIGDALPMSKQGPAAGKVLEADDMAALFGLDMGEGAEPADVIPMPTGKKTVAVAARKKAEPALKPVGSKVASAKTTAQVVAASPRKATRGEAAPPRKAAPKPVAWWKPAPPKQTVKGRSATGETTVPAVARKVKRAS
jgi:uncharacterized Zn finger protein